MPALSRARRTRALRGLAAMALLLPSACARYVALEPAAAPAGAEVRVTIADATRDELTRVLGPRTASLQGRVVQASDTSLTLAVATIHRTTGTYESWGEQPVTLPRAAIADVSRREVSPVRSGLLAAGLIALGVLIAGLFGDEADVGGSGRPGPGQPK